ncbi:hypothetical protein [Variovorax sp. Sphag1AA]|uniref:hypothetical protein n=1 Tax=Variovorax sp. Sphag1AA TaxID=2587027 RepID=UPI00160BC136|nr:hypothetical protein [Variovorax sp. Sphag1AA]MBB3180995.1 hypothetical protein [Variovorax sp. Sphag1AA]
MPTVLQVLGTVAVWVGLFKFNDWLFGYMGLSLVISWVFVPAAVRLLSVMLFGMRGALGLWIGALLTNHAFATPWQSIAVACLSSGGPVAAMYIGRRWLQLPASLQGLTPGKLFQLSVLAAACNAVPHNIFFWIVDLMPDPLMGIGPMFIGDLFGILLVLYTLRALISVGDQIAARRQA